MAATYTSRDPSQGQPFVWDEVAQMLGDPAVSAPATDAGTHTRTRVNILSPRHLFDEGVVEEPSFNPATDVWAPGAASAVKQGARDLTPALMRSVSRMAPYLQEALAAIRGERFQPPAGELPRLRAMPPTGGYPDPELDAIAREATDFFAQAGRTAAEQDPPSEDAITDAMNRIIESLQRTQNRLEPLSDLQVPDLMYRIGARQPMRETMPNAADRGLATWLELYSQARRLDPDADPLTIGSLPWQALVQMHHLLTRRKQ